MPTLAFRLETSELGIQRFCSMLYAGTAEQGYNSMGTSAPLCSRKDLEAFCNMLSYMINQAD